MALNGGRAGGSRPCEGFSLGAPFWSGLWQPFFLAALRTVSRSLTAVLYGTESMAGYLTFDR